MSKSEWKDLPDWTKLEDYAFLDGVPPEVWAWEFLRRIEEYRKDMDYYVAVVKKAKTIAGEQWRYSKWVMHYTPPKLDENESYTEWLARILSAGLDPIREAIHDYFPRKWGLNNMAPYDREYGKYVGFRNECYQYPRLIRDEDGFYLMTEERGPGKEMGNHQAYVTAVKADKAIVVFDLSAPLGPQKKRLSALLDMHYDDMKKYEKIKRSQVPKLLTEHLTRHLQVLDAKRTQPDIPPADIATGLGYNEEVEANDENVEDYDKSLGKKTPTQQGCRWIKQAESTRDSYLNFLIEPLSTTKKA